MKRAHPFFALALLATLSLLAACGTTSTSSGAAPTPTSTPAATSTTATTSPVVKTATATVAGASKTILTDAQGRTLYYFKPDTATKVACTGSCASRWPPLLLSAGTPTSATSLSGSLSTVMGDNGRQVTYNGRPLYTYANDSAPGDTNGEGVAGQWHVATPDLAAQGSGGGSSGAGY